MEGIVLLVLILTVGAICVAIRHQREEVAKDPNFRPRKPWSPETKSFWLSIAKWGALMVIGMLCFNKLEITINHKVPTSHNVTLDHQLHSRYTDHLKVDIQHKQNNYL